MLHAGQNPGAHHQTHLQVISARKAPEVADVPRHPGPTAGPIVTAAEPGHHFPFARTGPLAGTLDWACRFQPTAEGTFMSEPYAVTKPLSPIG